MLGWCSTIRVDAIHTFSIATTTKIQELNNLQDLKDFFIKISYVKRSNCTFLDFKGIAFMLSL